MFKYNDYPEINKAYKESQKLTKKSYKLGEKIWADGRGKDVALEANNLAAKYDQEVFAAIIYETFKDLKPELYNKLKKKQVKWEKVFVGEFENFTQDQKADLLGLVLEIGYGIYRLPEEYYNDIPLFGGFPMPIG